MQRINSVYEINIFIKKERNNLIAWKFLIYLPSRPVQIFPLLLRLSRFPTRSLGWIWIRSIWTPDLKLWASYSSITWENNPNLSKKEKLITNYLKTKMGIAFSSFLAFFKFLLKPFKRKGRWYWQMCHKMHSYVKVTNQIEYVIKLFLISFVLYNVQGVLPCL